MSELLIQLPAGDGVPRSDDAERGLLSCFLQSPEELLDDALSTMRPEWFYHSVNRLIYEELISFREQPGRMVMDPVTLNQHFIDKGLIDKIGGPSTLPELLNFVPTAAHYRYYKSILQDKFLLRSLELACRETIGDIRSYEEDPATVITQAEARIFDVLQASQNRGQFSSGVLSAAQAVNAWLEHMHEAQKHMGKIRGLTTGLHDLDRTMWGLDDKEGEIFVIAARPGQGKTAMACGIVEHFGLSGVPTLVFSLEMSLNQILDRIILGMAGIDTGKAQTGMFSHEDSKVIATRTKELAGTNLFFDASSDLSSADLRSKLQTYKRKHGIRAVVLDRLELVSAVTKQGQENERTQLVEVMKTLQWAKKELRLGIYVLMQMSRESDRRAQGAPPVLADLQGSGSPEQFAEHVGFIIRPSYYKSWDKLSEDARKIWIEGHDKARMHNPDRWSDGSKYPGQLDLHGRMVDHYARQDYEEHALLCLRKNRRGATPDIPLRYEAEFTRFSSRTPKLFSNNVAERQPGVMATEPAPKPHHDPEPETMEEIFG